VWRALFFSLRADEVIVIGREMQVKKLPRKIGYRPTAPVRPSVRRSVLPCMLAVTRVRHGHSRHPMAEREPPRRNRFATVELRCA
jgi:hypothetical protein